MSTPANPSGTSPTQAWPVRRAMWASASRAIAGLWHICAAWTGKTDLSRPPAAGGRLRIIQRACLSERTRRKTPGAAHTDPPTGGDLSFFTGAGVVPRIMRSRHTCRRALPGIAPGSAKVCHVRSSSIFAFLDDPQAAGTTRRSGPPEPHTAGSVFASQMAHLRGMLTGLLRFGRILHRIRGCLSR